MNELRKRFSHVSEKFENLCIQEKQDHNVTLL